MIVDSEVEQRIVLIIVNERRRRLLAAPVATGRFAGVHCGNRTAGKAQRQIGLIGLR